MSRFSKIALVLWVWTLAILAMAQTPETVTKWSAEVKPAGLRVGEYGQVLLRAEVQKGYHIYSMVEVKNGPFPTQATLTSDAIKVNTHSVLGTTVAKMIEPQPIEKFDPNFSLKVGLHEGKPEFIIPFQLVKAGTHKIVIRPMAQACNEKGCLRPWGPELSVTLTSAAGEVRPEWSKPVAAASQVAASGGKNSSRLEFEQAREGGLLSFFWIAFLAGLGALITPCVFPMIPVTVSFFSKSSGGSFRKQLQSAGLYCLGIIGTFTALGLGLTAISGPTGVAKLATNVWVNLFLSVLFVVLSLSLFGVYELMLPTKFVNKIDSAGRKAGFLAPIFMGTTFSLTTFTCTVAFVGTLLASSAQLGPLYSIVGMVGFSTAFALPFFVFALFPSLLHQMPKSGSWLSTVKATLGFVELMAALKFLSNVDLAWQAAILTQPVFLAVWGALAFVCAAYLFGWLRFPHETGTKVGWLRRAFAVGFAALGWFVLSALNGRPLGDLDAFLPPAPYPGQEVAGAVTTGELLPWETNLEQAKAKAKQEGKSLFIDFTGVFCTNCRYVEKNIFPKVEADLSKYVLVKLYTDRPGNAEDSKNNDLKLKLSGSAELPSYAILEPDATEATRVAGFTKDVKAFSNFLKGQGK